MLKRLGGIIGCKDKTSLFSYHCLRSFSFMFLPFLFLWRCRFFRDVCTITVLSLYGEYIVRFPLRDGVFLPCDHGLDFGHELKCEK